MSRYKGLSVHILVCWLILAHANHVASLQCYTCTDISDVSNCTQSVQCSSDQSCFLDTTTNGQSLMYTLGCIDKHQCSIHGSGTSELIGRDVQERNTDRCHECCGIDDCNKHLCEHFKPTTCIDDGRVDCAFLNTVTNVCQDVHHAKTICPRFCDLCSLVDGMWSAWSMWSSCDVTCGNSTQTRTRTCTNPSPKNGGLNCSGDAADMKVCNKQLCPVHGGWTTWAEWEVCSVTCDIGVQKRHRKCTNPVPSRFGDHCFGDPIDVRICEQGPCANGGWTEWGTWSSCSSTCGGGVRSQSRTCTNPRPSSSGVYCEGDNMKVTACNTGSCVPNIIFNAFYLTDLSPIVNQIMVFTQILVNDGNAYDSSTGVFTAPINGTYSFSAQQCGIHGSGTSELIGRDVHERNTDRCHECCGIDNCNKHLCEHLKPTTCIDDGRVDCAFLSTMTNICQDVHHAKTICPRFCDLCSLIDGMWSLWSTWSSCDVTCGNSTQTRTRTCTNPSPKNGGLNCSGDAADMKVCSKQLCPVHGGWTTWATWEICSVTCDIGVQKRHRTCSNPVPSRFGDHCFGDPIDVQICEQGPCANGGWTEWGTWSSCSSTCGGGVRSQSRTCTNPRPSLSGAYCDGKDMKVTACNTGTCVPNIIFNAYHITDLSPVVNQTMVFTQILFNDGNAYDSSTGVFTAPINGTYTFSAQLCVQTKSNMNFGIKVNDRTLVAKYGYEENCRLLQTVARI